MVLKVVLKLDPTKLKAGWLRTQAYMAIAPPSTWISEPVI